jgi:hypothetical protein
MFGPIANLPELLRRHGDHRQAEVYTAVPAIVKSYDSATQTADVQIVVNAPLVNDEDEADVDHEQLPIVPNVRVVFMSAGSIGVTMPIPSGTEGVLLVSTLQTGEFRRTGKASDAVDVRRNSLGCGGWFFPCKLSDGQLIDHASTNALVLEASEIRIGKNASEFIAMANKVLDELTALSNKYNSHTHKVTAFGSPSDTPATGGFNYSPSSVAATKGKVE